MEHFKNYLSYEWEKWRKYDIKWIHCIQLEYMQWKYTFFDKNPDAIFILHWRMAIYFRMCLAWKSDKREKYAIHASPYASYMNVRLPG